MSYDRTFKQTDRQTETANKTEREGQIFLHYCCDFVSLPKLEIHLNIGKLRLEIHFRGQNRHWRILTGVVVASLYVMGHLSTDFSCWMSIYR